jgi:hypothetical protein
LGDGEGDGDGEAEPVAGGDGEGDGAGEAAGAACATTNDAPNASEQKNAAGGRYLISGGRFNGEAGEPSSRRLGMVLIAERGRPYDRRFNEVTEVS